MSDEAAKTLHLADVPLRELVREMLRRLGEDTSRSGLKRTPERVENSLRWLTRGYHMSVADAVGNAKSVKGANIQRVTGGYT